MSDDHSPIHDGRSDGPIPIHDGPSDGPSSSDGGPGSSDGGEGRDGSKESGRVRCAAALHETGLEMNELWVRCVGVGGTGTVRDLRRYLEGSIVVSDSEHDMIVHALNERYMELGRNHPLPYLGIRN